MMGFFGSRSKKKENNKNLLEAVLEQNNKKLLEASENGDASVVLGLIASGADVNVMCENGWETPLHRASRYGHAAVVEALLDNGADVNSKTKSGWMPRDFAARRGHHDIVKVLNDNAISREKNKVLLLGPGQSGKTTVFKQMRCIYGTEWSEDDLRMYGVMVRSNIVVMMRKLCALLEHLGLQEELCAELCMSRQAYDDFLDNKLNSGEECEVSTPPKDWVGQSPRAGSVANKDAKKFLAHHETIGRFWQSNTIKKVWSKRNTYNIISTHKVFLDDIPRIASPAYKPTTQDVFMARIRTTGMLKQEFNIQGTNFEVYDTGGERSERRKWIDHFDEVTAVIYVVNISSYDQTLAEAKRTNRIDEAIELFRVLCNNPASSKAPIFLFLNMKDVFAEKILHSDISTQTPFCDYNGPSKDFDEGLRYFTQKFKECTLDDLDRLSIHVTCATDTNSMKIVMDSVSSMIKAGNICGKTAANNYGKVAFYREIMALDQPDKGDVNERLGEVAALVKDLHMLKLLYSFTASLNRAGVLSNEEASKHVFDGLSRSAELCACRDSIAMYKLVLMKAVADGRLSEFDRLRLDNDAEVARMSNAPFVKDIMESLRLNTARIEGLEANVEAINASVDKIRIGIKRKLKVEGIVGMFGATLNILTLGAAGGFLSAGLTAFFEGVVDFGDVVHLKAVAAEMEARFQDEELMEQIEKGIEIGEMAFGEYADRLLEKAVNNGNVLVVVSANAAMQRSANQDTLEYPDQETSVAMMDGNLKTGDKEEAVDSNDQYFSAVDSRGEVESWLLNFLPKLQKEDVVNYCERLVEKGFDSSETLEVVEEGDLQFMKDGHKRIFVRKLSQSGDGQGAAPIQTPDQAQGGKQLSEWI